MQQLHLWPEPATLNTETDTLKLAVTLEYGQERRQLTYELPGQYTEAITPSCDPFVVATLLLAMTLSAELRVHGTVSPSLIKNLSEFQAAWHCWMPDLSIIKIVADNVAEQEIAPQDHAIVAFSGGVDSCFTLFRHHNPSIHQEKSHNITAGLMVHGFDIPFDQKETFQRAVQRSRQMFDGLLGVDLISLATNFRWVVPNGWITGQSLDWTTIYGSALASCLMLFQKRYRIGLVGSSLPYHDLILPWGSNPITDPLFANSSFNIIHDGAGFDRLQKVNTIAQWPAALEHLRVCWQGKDLDKNCGQCEKCIRTILNFRVNGIPCPPAFEQDATNAQILDLTPVGRVPLTTELQPILDAADSKQLKDTWVSALRKTIQRSDRHWQVKSLGRAIKRLLFGTQPLKN